jgi:hypothetical protein
LIREKPERGAIRGILKTTNRDYVRAQEGALMEVE